MRYEIIDINKSFNISSITFPDSQPHVVLPSTIYTADKVYITCSIINTEVLFKLLLVNNVLEREGVLEKYLYIPYLMGARYDRVMQDGDSFDLKVVADTINSCNFRKVFILDPHSSVSTSLINRSKAVEAIPVLVFEALKKLNIKDASDQCVFICPDAGAQKKLTEYRKTLNNLHTGSIDVPIVYCNKQRDIKTGDITLTVPNPEMCKDKHCIIIDDLCDGGGTFIEIAKQITSRPKSLSLVVTHGIFSKGFSVLKQYFNNIFTTDSYCKTYEEPFVAVHPNNPMIYSMFSS
jgi:ribose-phosphate pyrophosphokinase